MKLARAWAGALAIQAGISAGGVVPGSGTPEARPGGDLLYEEVGRRWLERTGAVVPTEPGDLLEQRFAHVALGVFDVHLPASCLADAQGLERVRAALRAVLDVQEGWSAWVSGEEPRGHGADALTKWLGGLAPRHFGKRDGAGAEIAVTAQASDEVRASLARLRESLRSGPPLGVERELAGIPLVVFPRRAEFVEFVCALGVLDANLRSTAWNDGLASWLEYQAHEVHLVTLEYAGSDGAPALAKGESVGERNPAALAELVAQVAARALVGRIYAGNLDPALASGMANALVIDLHGELDTRIDGDVRARSSQGRSVFVPGGNPNGGVLPPTSAENRWRGTKGKDHFVRILARVQKQSGKRAPSRAEKLARFELTSDDGSEREVVSAPFLGPRAARPGDAVWCDYLELVRCYGVAFLHWLRVEGAPEPADSRALFGRLLRELSRKPSPEALPAVLQELYGQPLSSDGVEGLFDGPTLEGRFLAWLARQG